VSQCATQKEFALRIEAARQILFAIEKDITEQKTQKYFAKDVNILYACLESKKDIRKKTFETYKSILQNLDNYAKNLNINTLQRVDAIKFLNQLSDRIAFLLCFTYAILKNDKILFFYFCHFITLKNKNTPLSN
jgi:hypothetical protein